MGNFEDISLTNESKEPATREDIEKAKTEILVRLNDQNKATRAHIASELETVRGDGAIHKNFASRTFTAIKRLLEKMGVKTDDL